MPDAKDDALEALERANRERNFYRSLLALGTETAFEPFLEEALALIVELTGARQAFLELRDAQDEAEGSWQMAHGCTDAEVDEIRSSISRGIIAEALASGEAVVTQSALLDERFRDRSSVKISRIEAVLCVPVGGSADAGVVYLQDRQCGGGFSAEDRHFAEAFARNLAPLADRLLARRSLEESRDHTRRLREKHSLPGIVGRSRALASALEQAMLAAPLDVTVLLSGDSGTGKSKLARAVHTNSSRADGPFIEINCAALPATLLESELFGARAGGHSEAKVDRAGRVAAAENGTLFLDEVGEMPLESQPKLLQLLQSHEYYPIGAGSPECANVRVIAASNIDLESAVREGRFREDLFFRLQVLPVRLPSLAERREDLPFLAGALIDEVVRRNRMTPLELSPGALRAVDAAEWPGNVRQLEHAIEAAAIRAAGEGVSHIEARHVFCDVGGKIESEEFAPSFQEETRRFQRELLRQTLESEDWNVAATARRLDLARSHVYNLIGAFGLKRG